MESLSLVTSPVEGRHYVATRAVETGELLLVEQPYALTVDDNHLCSVCHNCLADREGILMLPCPDCQVLRYCSAECRTSDGPHHELECKSLRKVHPRRPPQSVRLMLRVLRRWKREIQQSDAECSLRCEQLNSLVHHRDKALKKSVEMFAQLAVLTKLCLLENEELPLMDDMHALIDMYLRFEANCVTVSNVSLQAVGAGLYLNASKFNHRCAANSAAVFSGPELTIRALRACVAGEPLTFSYIDTAAPTAARQLLLKRTYRFICKCSMCLDTERDSTLNPTELEHTLPVLNNSEACLNKGDARAAREMLEGLLSDLPPGTTLVHYRALSVLLRACIDLQDWPHAYRYCSMSVPAYTTVYGHVHPLTGMQHLMKGKLAWYIGDKSEARAALESSRAILLLTHGEGHAAVRELQSLYAQVTS